MITITKEQARDRFTLLPLALQDAVFSVQTAEIISAVGEQYHIPDDKLQNISSLIGWVLLGFLHVEDLPGEIATSTAIAPQLAKDITDSLTNKLFFAIKPEIDKAYAPVPHEKSPELTDAAQDASPTILETTPQKPFSPTPIKKPTTLSDVGWSRASSAGPGIRLSAVPSITPQTPPRASAIIPPSSALTPPTKPSSPAEPAPMILHQDTTFKATEKNASFTLSRPGAGADVHIGQGGPSAPTPPRPAVLEFGGAPNPPVANKPAPPAQGGAVHYTDFKVSLSAIPTANTGPRNVSQVAAPQPMAPTMPKPPAPAATPAPVSALTPPIAPIPHPPQTPPTQQIPPAPRPQNPPQKDKPIVKDFL